MGGKQEYYPRIMGAILLLFIFDTVTFLIDLFFLSGSMISGVDLLIGALAQLMSLCIIALCLKFVRKLSIEELFTFEGIPMKSILPIILVIFGSSIVFSEIDNLFRIFIPVTGTWLQIFQIAYGSSEVLWTSIISAVIVAPIVEEILFRGIILRGFLKHYSPKKAIIASALIFGVMHMNPWQFLGAFLAGILIGYVFYKTHSILLCILIHAFDNSLGFIAKDLLKLDIQGYTTDISLVSHQPIWFDMIGVVLLITGVFLLIRVFNNLKVDEDYNDESNLSM